MVFSIYALDNEFAVSTGTNVNSSPGRSKFDYPPTSSIDLVITTKDGDPDPRVFDVGDVYDISWTGAGGGATIVNAVVVRSDSAPNGGGVIVLEGTDENGNLAQVIWTPGMDLEQWYFDNFNQGTPPEFYSTDQNAAYTHEFVCFSPETRICTPKGAVAAGQLRAGQIVQTIDNGPQPLLWTGQRTTPGILRLAPIAIAQGVLGNTQRVRLSQNHRVLVKSPMAELLFGVAEVLVPARALLGVRGVSLRPQAQTRYVHLLFERHELLRVGGGMVAESLFLGRRSRALLQGHTRTLPNISDHARTARQVLRMRDAKFLISQDIAEFEGRSGIAHRRRLRNSAAAKGVLACSGIISSLGPAAPGACLPNG